MGALPAVDEEGARWTLINRFRAGVRGSHGSGKACLRVLGSTTFGTPVPLPDGEDVSTNTWIVWAEKEPEGARLFWSEYQKFAATADRPEWFLLAAEHYLREHGMDADARELIQFCSRHAGPDHQPS